MRKTEATWGEWLSLAIVLLIAVGMAISTLATIISWL